jgi:hypothetical protein
MSKQFPLIIFKSIQHKVFIFHMLIGHNCKMTRIDFRVSRSNVKVTGAFNIRMVTADYLEKYSL